MDRLKITEASGRVITGYVQGVGGLTTMLAVQRAARRASAGQPTLMFEPESGKCAVYSHYNARANGDYVLADLRRAKVEMCEATNATWSDLT